MKKTFFKIAGVIANGIIFIVIAAIFYNWTKSIWAAVGVAYFYWSMLNFFKWQNKVDKKLAVLEGKEGELPNSGGIKYIIQFKLELGKLFLKASQAKTGLSDEIIKKIDVDIPTVDFKIEEYVGDFTRVKVWYFWNEKQRYAEDDNPQLYSQPYLLWNINFCSYLPEDNNTDISGTSIRLTYHEGEFILALIGGKFGEKDCIDHDEPLEENILLRVPTYDFKKLEKHHLLYNESYQDATCSWYYSPEDNYREYKYPDLPTSRKVKDGIYWDLKWHDFTQQFLPKLKYKKGTLTVESVEFREEPIT